MKYNFIIKEVSKETALDMIQKYHYSNTLPRLNKYFLGVHLDGTLVGVVTLGYGTRPLHTIQALFKDAKTEDYLEIGRMCMTDDMPKNSESQMLRAVVKWIRANTDIKVLFTWADGMLGKCGYVYQASNFMYVGKSESDIYLFDGYKIHPRQTKPIFKRDENDKRVTIRPTVEQLRKYHISRYKGHQFKYLIVLGSHKEKREMMERALFEVLPNPKEKDLEWKTYDLDIRKWVPCGKPPYKTDFSKDFNKDELIKMIKKAGGDEV